MSLMNAIAGKKSAKRNEALKRYAQILEQQNADDADELLELAAQLGKSEVDIQADARVIAGWKTCEQTFFRETAKGLQLAEVRKELKAFRAETAAFMNGREAIELRLDQTAGDLEMAVRGGYRQIDHMREMQKKHPDLFLDKVLPAA
jgi:hypothetical protein